jgi:predicted nucleic acid-binding Zn ribbon protein
LEDKPSLCKVCAKPIPEGARKCTECDEYQQPFWRIVSWFDLKGLIALVPIITLSYVFIQDRIEIKQSDLRIALISCEQKKVSLFASNIGNRAAIVSGASFRTAGLPVQPLQVSLPPEARLINGGETRALELLVNPEDSPGGLVPFDVRGTPECRVSITIETIAFDHKLEPQEIVCDCPD